MMRPAWNKRFAPTNRISDERRSFPMRRVIRQQPVVVAIRIGKRRGMRSETAPSPGPIPSMSAMVTVLAREICPSVPPMTATTQTGK